MDVNSLKQLVADTGRILLDKELVARTWGNISAKMDNRHFAISPSGLGYENMTAEDVPIYCSEDETFEGPRKPSSEKRIHAAAYRNYPEVGFVIHSHQDYATAVSLEKPEKLPMTAEESAFLGKIALAGYGLPGTKKLCAQVETALKSGSKVILMAHHGALVLGSNQEEAINKAEVLERVCKRYVEAKIGTPQEIIRDEFSMDGIVSTYPNAKLISDGYMIAVSRGGAFRAQLDDMAQMVGGKLKCVESNPDAALKILKKRDAVLVKNVGCVVKADDPDDVKALILLLSKAAISKLYTDACGKKISLSVFDSALMHAVYKKKYSKQKKGN